MSQDSGRAGSFTRSNLKLKGSRFQGDLIAEPIALSGSAQKVLDLLRTSGRPVFEEALSAAAGLDRETCVECWGTLRRFGYEISRSVEHAYEFVRAPDRLLPNEVTRHLDTSWLGRRLYCFDLVGSTNTVARNLARQGATSGTVVLAEAQSRGRGRLGRSWVSPARKNLYLSIVLRVDLPAAELPRLSLLAGVAACDTVSEWHAASIKWPNDILIDGRKVGGILTELEGREGSCQIVGIGLNLNTEMADFPSDLQDKAGSLLLALGRRVDRAHLAGRLLTHFERRYMQLTRDGFAPIAAAWRRRCEMIGRLISVAEPAGVVEGTVLGLEDDGSLRIRTACDGDRRILAGDVTVVGGYDDSPVSGSNHGDGERSQDRRRE